MPHEIKYPRMRMELIETMRALSDAEYQRQAWVDHNYPPGIEYDDFNAAIHFLYDDASLDKAAGIGELVKDENEAAQVSEVIKALNRVFEAKGLDATDEEYISSPEWQSVLTTALAAYQLLKSDP